MDPATTTAEVRLVPFVFGWQTMSIWPTPRFFDAPEWTSLQFGVLVPVRGAAPSGYVLVPSGSMALDPRYGFDSLVVEPVWLQPGRRVSLVVYGDSEDKTSSYGSEPFYGWIHNGGVAMFDTTESEVAPGWSLLDGGVFDPRVEHTDLQIDGEWILEGARPGETMGPRCVRRGRPLHIALTPARSAPILAVYVPDTPITTLIVAPATVDRDEPPTLYILDQSRLFAVEP